VEDADDQLYEISNQVTDKKSFVAFLEAFRSDLVVELARPESETAWGAGRWSHPDLKGFLETLGASLIDHRGRYEDLDPGAWQAFADMLMTARIYE
jgi:hypothetical protein